MNNIMFDFVFNFLNQPVVKKIQISPTGLQFSHINVKQEYLEKWNATGYTDFICLTKNEELLRPTLYRVGGVGKPNLATDEYFMLLKYTEAFYKDDITTDAKRKPHLDGRWCILDKHGNEKIVFESSLSYSTIIKNSCIYAIDRKYYNIETGEYYGTSNSSIESSEFLFIEPTDEKTYKRIGVKKINKKDGTWELFE